MRRGAALLLLFMAGCVGARPAAAPRSPDAGFTSFQALFQARTESPAGRARFRGAIAVGGNGRLRAEITGVSAAAPIIIIAGPDGVFALDVAQHTCVRGDPESPIVERLTGLPLAPGIVSMLLGADASRLPEGCSASIARRQLMPGGIPVARRLSVRCGGAEMSWSLSRIAPLAASAGQDPFSLHMPPAICEEVGLDDFIEGLAAGLR